MTSIQILKFGQEVDLDAIEGMSVNKTAEELRLALKKLEARGEPELAAWEQRLSEAASELSRVTKANTEKLARVAELTRTQVTAVTGMFVLVACLLPAFWIVVAFLSENMLIHVLQHRLESELNAAQSKMVTDVGQSRCVCDARALLSAQGLTEAQGRHAQGTGTAHQPRQTAGQRNGGACVCC